MGTIFSGRRNSRIDEIFEEYNESVNAPCQITELDDTPPPPLYHHEGNILHMRLAPIEDDIEQVTNECRVPPLYEICLLVVAYHVAKPTTKEIEFSFKTHHQIRPPYPQFANNLGWDQELVSGAALEDLWNLAMEFGWIRNELVVVDFLTQYLEYLDLSKMPGGATDEIVAAICESCPFLLYLNLTMSVSLTGRAIASITENLRDLTHLYCGGCIFLTDADVQPLARLAQIEVLVLSNTSVTFKSAESFMKLPAIRKLFVVLCPYVTDDDMTRLLRSKHVGDTVVCWKVDDVSDLMRVEKEKLEKEQDEWRNRYQ